MLFRSIPETCNGVDDDCNGIIDDAFDKANDPKNCGTCGRQCLTGFVCRTGNCLANIETICFDGVDNNNDGCLVTLVGSGR